MAIRGRFLLPELRAFHGKLTPKFGRVRNGFFIAPGGFAKTFAPVIAQHASGDVLVIPVDAEDLVRGPRRTIDSP